MTLWQGSNWTISNCHFFCHHESLSWISNPSFWTSEYPFWYIISVIESFHHASAVHERLCTKLFESIQDLLPSAYKGLFLPWGCSTYASCSITLLRRTVLTFIWCKLQPMDIAEDIMAQVEVCLVTGTNYHHSLLPPSGRTFSSESRNASIHKSFIHCSSSQLPFLLLDCF